MLSGNCGKDTNHSSAKTVKFLGYKFHVECRNLQSYDLYLLKSPFITCNIFFLPVQDFFFLLLPNVSRAERSQLENASGFLKTHHKVRRGLAVSKGYIRSIWSIPKDVHKSYQVPSRQLQREAGQDAQGWTGIGWVGTAALKMSLQILRTGSRELGKDLSLQYWHMENQPVGVLEPLPVFTQGPRKLFSIPDCK